MSKKNLQLQLVDAADTPQENKAAFESDDFFEQLDELARKGAEMNGRIYRVTNPQDPGAAWKRVFLAAIDGPVTEDYMARRFGGGTFKLRYRINTKSGPLTKDAVCRIDDSFKYSEDAPAIDPAPTSAQATAPAAATPGLLNGFLGSLTAEKITAFTFLIEAARKLKEMFAPPPPPTPAVDVTKLIEVVANITNNKQTSASDAVVIKALESINQQQRATSPLQQWKDFKALQDELKENETENQGGDDMNGLIKLALETLPILLAKNNRDYRAAGAEAAQMPVVKNIIRNNPGLAKEFFEHAVKDFGQAAALQLAEGFGFVPTPAPQMDAAAAQMTPGADDSGDGEEEDSQDDNIAQEV